MNRQRCSMKAFTLIEVMIALLIVTVMTSLTLITFHSLYKTNEIQHFLNIVQQDLYLAQQTAIATGVRTFFYVDNDNGFYSIKQRTNHLFIQPFDEQFSIVDGTLRINEIAFNPNGNISKPGTVIIRTSQESYKLVFQLGRGRFYVQKL